MKHTSIKQTTADKLDALIAAAMHCKARRAEPNYSFEGAALYQAIFDLTEIDAVHEAAAEMAGELERPLMGEVA